MLLETQNLKFTGLIIILFIYYFIIFCEHMGEIYFSYWTFYGGGETCRILKTCKCKLQ